MPFSGVRGAGGMGGRVGCWGYSWVIGRAVQRQPASEQSGEFGVLVYGSVMLVCRPSIRFAVLGWLPRPLAL
jgi:hypothetical protein